MCEQHRALVATNTHAHADPKREKIMLHTRNGIETMATASATATAAAAVQCLVSVTYASTLYYILLQPGLEFN